MKKLFFLYFKALMVLAFEHFKDNESRSWQSDLTSDNTVCRTPPDTPGLLKRTSHHPVLKVYGVRKLYKL